MIVSVTHRDCMLSRPIEKEEAEMWRPRVEATVMKAFRYILS